MWADERAEHWIVERALPFENPMVRFGSSQGFVRLKTHDRHDEMKTKLLAMLHVDLRNETKIEPILDSQIVDHKRR